ncbi:hypothetical protein HDU97_002384 [Phlyctochytrium planicorne]|nr:hypothetical protein HDU97_002384 [Phlyctochytrium planicorne]
MISDPSNPNPNAYPAHTPNQNGKPHTSNPLTKNKRIKPVVDEGGLSIVERVFFKSAPGRPQVIMGIILRLRLPPDVKQLKLGRVVDLLKIAQAKHYRLASSIDPETMMAVPLATNAKDLPCNYRFVARKTRDTWREVYEEEINTNFDVNDPSRPLWRNAIILREELMPKESDEVMINSSQLNISGGQSAPILTVTAAEDDDIKGKGPANEDDHQDSSTTESVEQSVVSKGKAPAEPTLYGLQDPEIVPGEEYFEIMFTFHHCLGDGLSMFAYARTFLENANSYHLNSDNLHLETIPVVTTPPPLIDNLLDPWFLEVIPVIGGMAIRNLAKKGRRFKGRKEKPDHNATTEGRAVRPTAVVKRVKRDGAVTPDRSPSPQPLSRTSDSRSPSPAPSDNGADPATSSQALAAGVTNLPKQVNSAYTRVRFLWFDADFISALRKRSKAEGTTIAAVLVVASLAAVRTSFEGLPKYAKKALPSHQGWVVTNSVRHMLPMSNLIKGGDREIDEGLKLFGGYAGSVTNSSLLIEDSSDVWERCRVVRKSISKCFRDSIQRMKLMNYCYRHPRLWRMVEKKVDLAKLSRSYSVEVANLGAWEYPAAPPSAGPEDQRVRLDNFGGVVNSSFDGVRGLFTVGVITLGGNMSVAVGYDMASVHEQDADTFLKALCGGLMKLKDLDGKVTVEQIRK